MNRAILLSAALLALLPVAHGQVSLSPPQLIPCGDDPGSFALGDMDGDGDQDVVVKNQSSASYLENLGGGVFAPRVPIFTGIGENSSVRVADTNLDGYLDLILTSGTQTGTGSFGIVVLGNGDGSFSPAVSTFSIPSGSALFSVGFLNSDSIPDLAIPTWSSDEILIYIGTGTGSFVPGQTINAPEVPDIALGDLDGDGDVDIAACEDFGLPGKVAIYLNSGFGSFVPGAPVTLSAIPTTSDGPHFIEVTDLDDDGDLDVAALSHRDSNSLPPGTGGYVSVLLNDGNATFSSVVSSPLFDYPSDLAVGDLNLDGVDDLVVSRWQIGGVHVIENDGSSNLTLAQGIATGSSPAYVLISDVTSDGNADVLVSNWQTEELAVMINQGQAAPPSIPYPGTNEDLFLSTGIAGASPTTGVGEFVKVAGVGETIQVFLSSPQGGFALSPFIMAAEPFPTGTPPATFPGFPSVHMSPPGMVYLFDSSAGPFQNLLGFGGFSFVTAAPPFLAGQSVMFQAVAVSGTAANGIFAATDAHEIQVQ